MEPTVGNIVYEIDDIGPLHHVEVNLRAGLNILRGRNGAGKTTALRAIARASGAKVPVEKRDGAKVGEIRGDGILLRVGKVVTSKGEASLELADETTALSRLIDPGIVDTDAAARARIRALVELLGLVANDASLARLCPDEAHRLTLAAGMNAAMADDLLAAAEKLRGMLHAEAREAEDRVQSEQGAADESARLYQTALAEIGGELLQVTAASAQETSQDATRALERGSLRHQAREELASRQEQIRESLGERPDVDDATTRHVATQEALQSARRALAEAERRHDAAVSADDAAFNQLVQTTKAAETWDTQKAILDQPLDGPTAEEVSALRRTAGTALEFVRMATKSEEAAKYQQRAKDAAHSAAEAAALAKSLRAEAHAIPERLGEILADAGAPGVTIINGRLHAVVDDGEPIDFETRLSDGQRTRVALDIVTGIGKGLLPLEGKFLASLDPTKRNRLGSLAAERGLIIVSELATDGDLHVEHIGEEPETSPGHDRRWMISRERQREEV